MPSPHPRLLPLLALALAGTGAHAEGADDLKFRASATLFHDSNLFRLPDNANTQVLIGRSSAAENITITALGVNYNKAYSLQRFEFDLSLNKYNYQNFGYLDFTAVNYAGAWRWSYTPHLYGNITTSRNETLNSFVDYQGFNQRNVRTDTSTRADATYELDARWRLIGGVTWRDHKNTVQTTQEADYNYTAADIGARYQLPSGSSATYTLRSVDGRYTTNRVLPSAGFYDNGYTQTDNEVTLRWAISPDTSADFRAGHRSRGHPNYPQRDFDGMIGGANFNWAVTAKSLLVAGWRRELEAYETGTSNFTRIDRFSIGPVWQVSPKATLRVQLEHGVRDFKGAPLGVASGRRDTTRDASVSFDWQPYTFLAFSASLQNARRSSNTAGFDYNANMVNLTAQFTY